MSVLNNIKGNIHMSQEQWEIPLRERVAVIEADQRQMKDAIYEIKDAVVGIRTTLETVVRMEEKALTLAENDLRLGRDIENEINNRKEQAVSYGERIGALEKDVSMIKTKTELNSHGRTMFERILVPVMAGIISATVALAGSYAIRDQATQPNVNISTTQE